MIIKEPETLPKELAAKLDKTAKKYGAKGVQVSVIKDGSVAFVYNYGYADTKKKVRLQTENKYRIASLSKPVVAMCAMNLVESGKLDLDADIGDYLGYKVRNPNYPSQKITARMLMTHTSTIIDSSAFLSSRNSHSSVKLKTLLSKKSSYSSKQPGKSYRYSNFGVAVLAAAIEKITGEYFKDTADEILFSKLGVDAQFLASELDDTTDIAVLYTSGGGVGMSVKKQLNESVHETIGQTHHLYQGNLTTGAADYAKILCVLFDDENGILSKESIDMMLSEQYKSSSVTQGLCFMQSKKVVKGRTMYCHTGSNFGAYHSFAIDPEDKSGVVVLTSGADAEKNSAGLYDVCCEMIRSVYSDGIME